MFVCFCFVISVCWSVLVCFLLVCCLFCSSFVFVCVCFENIAVPAILVFLGLMLVQSLFSISVFGFCLLSLFCLLLVLRYSYVVCVCVCCLFCSETQEKLFSLFASCFLVIFCLFFRWNFVFL